MDFSFITDILNFLIGLINYIMIMLKHEEAQTFATMPRKK